MNGHIALLIALVSYGNSYLQTENSGHHLDFNNTTLKYCSTLSFIDTTLSFSNKLLASNPQLWFAHLKKDSCKKLKLRYNHSNESQMKDFESAGFVGGGGEWLIEAVYNDHSDYWNCSEYVVEPESKGDRIWNTVIKKVEKNQPISPTIITVENAKKDLLITLNKIMAFSLKEQTDYWRGVFKSAIDKLDSPYTEIPYYNDCIIDSQYALQNKQLLSAATTASVFGGMGSWNDIVYPTDEANKTNELLSADLYNKINDAIIASVNNN